jgi:hypothetical protein
MSGLFFLSVFTPIASAIVSHIGYVTVFGTIETGGNCLPFLGLVVCFRFSNACETLRFS